MNLFKKEEKTAPLAWRMRPKSLEEFVGQKHLVGKGKFLRRRIESDTLSSLILYGPPGCGKTALAGVIAHTTGHRFVQINAVTSGVQDLRRVVEEAEKHREVYGEKTILFIDELHRFNRAQQDALLPWVEKGSIILIGATTLNPFFSVNPTLISRSDVFEFKPLEPEEIKIILKRALKDKERGLGNFKLRIKEEVLVHLSRLSNGDARRALRGLELSVLTSPPDRSGYRTITKEVVEECLQKKALVYDREGNAHYDTISAFIKSMRGSDPDATLYWLGKMLYGGEDPRFIARRILICASEDVGNADPLALVVAASAYYAVEVLGLPEAQLSLAQAAVYVACAPKSNAVYEGISKAMEDVKKNPTLEVPPWLKNVSYPGAKKLGRGEGYLYPHSFPGGWVKQDYLPEKRIYYRPKEIGKEKELKERLKKLREEK